MVLHHTCFVFCFEIMLLQFAFCVNRVQQDYHKRLCRVSQCVSWFHDKPLYHTSVRTEGVGGSTTGRSGGEKRMRQRKFSLICASLTYYPYPKIKIIWHWWDIPSREAFFFFFFKAGIKKTRKSAWKNASGDVMLPDRRTYVRADGVLHVHYLRCTMVTVTRGKKEKKNTIHTWTSWAKQATAELMVCRANWVTT